MLARQFPQTLELLHPMKLALDLEQPLENTPGLEEVVRRRKGGPSANSATGAPPLTRDCAFASDGTSTGILRGFDSRHFQPRGAVAVLLALSSGLEPDRRSREYLWP